MGSPLVSIVIPTYRVQAGFLADALESVLGQSYPRIEAVLVHDGSREVLGALSPWKDDTRLAAHRETGSGYISALNQGIELARGDYIAFCDSDDILNRDHVRVLANTLNEFPAAGLAFDNLTYFVEGAGAAAHRLEPYDAVDGKPLISSEWARELVSRGVTLQNVFTHNLISGPAFMVPKRVLARVGAFDPNAFLMNDLHLFYRIGAGFPLRYVDYVGVRKRVHAANLTTVHPHYEYGVGTLENIRERYPDVYRRIGRRVFNKKLARKYYRLAVYIENSGDGSVAKELYRNAMLTRKLNVRYWWAYLRRMRKPPHPAKRRMSSR